VQPVSPPPPSAVATLVVCSSITVWKSLAVSGSSRQVAPAPVALSIAFCQVLVNFV